MVLLAVYRIEPPGASLHTIYSILVGANQQEILMFLLVQVLYLHECGVMNSVLLFSLESRIILLIYCRLNGLSHEIVFEDIDKNLHN
jgi:hypothetical protein